MKTAALEGGVGVVEVVIMMKEKHCDAFLKLTGSISSLRHSLQLSCGSRGSGSRDLGLSICRMQLSEFAIHHNIVRALTLVSGKA